MFGQARRNQLLEAQAKGIRAQAIGRAAMIGIAAAAGVGVFKLTSFLKKGITMGTQAGLSSPLTANAMAKLELAKIRFQLDPRTGETFSRAIEMAIPVVVAFMETARAAIEALEVYQE